LFGIGLGHTIHEGEFESQDGAAGSGFMSQIDNINPTCEHGLFLRLFISNGGGW
jgi:hypothetical protein